MAYKTCPDCGCRIFEYGCVNCDEDEYIAMQREDDDEPYDLNDDIIEDLRNGTLVRSTDNSDKDL